jgi:hypothetical protein
MYKVGCNSDNKIFLRTNNSTNINKTNYHLSPSERHFQQYFSYIVAVSFIGGGNRGIRRKPLTWRKSLTNFIT